MGYLNGNWKKLFGINILICDKYTVLKKEKKGNYFEQLQVFTVYGQYTLDTVICAKSKRFIIKMEEISLSYNTLNKPNKLISGHNLEFLKQLCT